MLVVIIDCGVSIVVGEGCVVWLIVVVYEVGELDV